MFDEIISLYKIGKELGLTKKEINKILLFDNSKYPRHYNLLLFLILLLIIILGVFSVFTISRYVASNTYARGTKYSSIGVKDFQKGTKNRKIKKFIFKI